MSPDVEVPDTCPKDNALCSYLMDLGTALEMVTSLEAQLAAKDERIAELEEAVERLGEAVRCGTERSTWPELWWALDDARAVLAKEALAETETPVERQGLDDDPEAVAQAFAKTTQEGL